MKREGINTIFIHGFPWALSYLLLFECVLVVVIFESILKMELRNGSRLYKNCDTVGELTMVLRLFSQMFRLSKSRHRIFILS